MPAEVVWSPVAVDYLDAIREWIADENDEPAAADRTITAILDRVDGAADFPLATTPLDSRCRIKSNWRSVEEKGYTAFIRVERDRMYVDRVLSGKSDFLRKLFSLDDGAAWRHGVRTSSPRGAHEVPGEWQAEAPSHDTCQISDHMMHKRVRAAKDAAPDLSAACYGLQGTDFRASPSDLLPLVDSRFDARKKPRGLSLWAAVSWSGGLDSNQRPLDPQGAILDECQ
jgi:toxin ParE1/3/4